MLELREGFVPSKGDIRLQKQIVKLEEFYKKCSSLEKYLDIVKLWDDIHLNEEKAYSDIDKVIRNKAYVEKLDGSRSEDVKKQLVKLANGDWS